VVNLSLCARRARRSAISHLVPRFRLAFDAIRLASAEAGRSPVKETEPLFSSGVDIEYHECYRWSALALKKGDYTNQRLGASFFTRAHQRTRRETVPVKARILQIMEFLPDSDAFGRLTSRPFSPDYAAQATMP
jgi:hypothetical protein